MKNIFNITDDDLIVEIVRRYGPISEEDIFFITSELKKLIINGILAEEFLQETLDVKKQNGTLYFKNKI